MTKSPVTSTMVGQQYGLLTVLDMLDSNSTGLSGWVRARCECGKIVERPGGNLRSGATRSCGCLAHIKHFHFIEQIPPLNRVQGDLRIVGSALMLSCSLAEKKYLIVECIHCGSLEVIPSSSIVKLNGRKRCKNWKLHKQVDHNQEVTDDGT